MDLTESSTEFNHETVDHGIGEYVRGDVHTNTVEGWFALLKRGVTGTFHHVSEEHLNRYVDEFAFRYNNRETTDAERAVKAIRKIEGKRLYYKDPIKKWRGGLISPLLVLIVYMIV